MGARTKINSAHFAGAALMGTFAGFAFQSLIAGMIVTALLLVFAVHAGDVRLQPKLKRVDKSAGIRRTQR